MIKALFINGVFENVLEEILVSQENNPDITFYLQPYSGSTIRQLKDNTPQPDSPMTLYISTTGQLNQICYSAAIIGWENKTDLSEARLKFLNEHIKHHQKGETDIYLDVNGKPCVNLISIRNLKKLSNQLSTSHLIKVNDGKPLKPRSRAGRWSYVYDLPLLLIDETVVKERLDEELARSIARSSKDNDEFRNKRLAKAPKIPKKVQTISFDFRRNADVVVAVLKRAQGKCELCKSDAPFSRASDGSPYLEVHHWEILSEGGEDTIENAAALCPNCHKNTHFGQDREFIKSNRMLANS